jgi:hypothetical protein
MSNITDFITFVSQNNLQPPPRPPGISATGIRVEESLYYIQKGPKDYLYVYPGTRNATFLNAGDAEQAMAIEFGLRGADHLLQRAETLHRIREYPLAYAGSLPGYSRGLHEENGKRLFCTSQPNLITPATVCASEPMGQSWPTIHAIMNSLLVSEDGSTEQLETMLAALKTSRAELERVLQPHEPRNRRTVRPGQAIALVGPKDSMKSFTLSAIIVPILGGRQVEAYKPLSTEADGFNGELLNGEVLVVDDRESSTDIRQRRRLGQNIKNLIYGKAHSIHAKYGTPITLHGFWRLFICLNEEPENLNTLPPMDDGIRDKIHLFKCNNATPPIANRTPEERAVLDQRIAEEIPFFLGFLRQWQIPEQYLHDRSGVLTYQNSEILTALNSQAPEAFIAEAIQDILGERREPWDCTAREVYMALTSPDNGPSRQITDLLRHTKSCGTYLGRLYSNPELASLYGLRVEKRRVVRGTQEWRIINLNPALRQDQVFSEPNRRRPGQRY